jgi:hypothetical protein
MSEMALAVDVVVGHARCTLGREKLFLGRGNQLNSSS